MSSSKSTYIYPNLNGNKILYKGKRFLVFEISSEFPFQGQEKYCDLIVYDKAYGCEIAGAQKTSNGFVGSLIGPQNSVDVLGNNPIELVDSMINSFRFYEKYFAGFITPSTPRVRKRKRIKNLSDYQRYLQTITKSF